MLSHALLRSPNSLRVAGRSTRSSWSVLVGQQAPNSLQQRELASSAPPKAVPEGGYARAQPSTAGLSGNFASISEEERFLFDLEGYLVVKNVFTKEEVAAANAAVDRKSEVMVERKGALRNSKNGTFLAGDGKTGRMDLAGMLGWPKGDREVFRDVLCHPKLVPYYHAFCGEGYRLDHLPLLIAQREGSEGFTLHGGPLDEKEAPNFFLTYHGGAGIIRTSLLAAAVQLTDSGAGDGGFCVLRGSHKANFRVPDSVAHGEAAFRDRLHQPVTEAGDVVLFSECTSHGTLPWTNAAVERRAVLYRFAPSNMAYGRAYTPEWPVNMRDGLTEAQAAVLEPPYNNRLDRPFLRGVLTSQEQQEQAEEDEATQIEVDALSRADLKKNFDKKIFGTDYF